ncbi:MAG: acyl-CoA dehydrogenase, partial [Thermodesulfobacteriota bacterium]
MAQAIADRRDVDFVLHEQFEISRFSKHDRFADFNKKVIDMIITEARNLAVKEILPTMKIGDKEGCRYENGRVMLPAQFKPAWDKLSEGGWFAPDRDPEWGGQGIPQTLNVMAQNYLIGANLSLLMVAGLNPGAGQIIEKFGTDKQKSLYLKKLYTGHWSGTMLLTESESGSNLGDLETRAVKNQDGTYSLSGNKIFISGGDHDMTENIIHLVLARIEGAPEGSRGISLFIVPKILINDDGSFGDHNDIICTGIEEKMGLHGSPTCSMALGSRGKCIGTLLGEENKGLQAMFVMMNHSRLMVGSQGLACASSAYLNALSYARTRIQGPLPASRDKKPVAIIKHPDVRRMLLSMKMYTEGMRSLLCYIASLEDKKSLSINNRKKEEYQDLIDILIPIAKGYVTDRSLDICNMAVQVLGGYGYTGEFPVEQILRDVRITTIYEGTNGIQAIDLLSRKLAMKENTLFLTLVNEILKTIGDAKKISTIKDMAISLGNAVSKFSRLARQLDRSAKSEDIFTAYSFACMFLEVTGDITMAWMLLWRAMIAEKKLNNNPRKKDIDFYKGQLNSAEFFIRSFLPISLGKMDSIMDSCSAAVDICDGA